MSHVCPNRCHVCPDMYKAYLQGCRERGETPTQPRTLFTMPMCSGGAIYPEYWKQRCTCYRGPSKTNPIEALEARVSVLERQLDQQSSKP